MAPPRPGLAPSAPTPEEFPARRRPRAGRVRGRRWGCVVKQPDARVDEAAVRAFAIANGPAYAHPRFVEFIDAIPLAATNKPDRRRLTEEAERLARQRRPTSGAA